MLKAKKRDREYSIKEDDIDVFVRCGYDIYRDSKRIRKGMEEEKLTNEQVKERLYMIDAIVSELLWRT